MSRSGRRTLTPNSSYITIPFHLRSLLFAGLVGVSVFVVGRGLNIHQPNHIETIEKSTTVFPI